MIRLLSIPVTIVLLTLSGCSVVHTMVGTFIGTLSADIVKDEIDKDDGAKKQ
jgi:uncharacterized protein YceK